MIADMEIVVLFSCRLKKWNKYSIKQDRNLVITNVNVYNFKQKSKCIFMHLVGRPTLLRAKTHSFIQFHPSPTIFFLELRRVVPIKQLGGLTKLLKTGSNEFVVHVKKEHDYRLLSEQ